MNSPDPDSMGDADRAVADFKAEVAAERRRSERWKRDRNRETATLAGYLCAAIESQIVVHPACGPAASGNVIEVGRDYICVENTLHTLWFSLAAVTAVESNLDPARRRTQELLSPWMMVDVIEDLMLAESAISVTLSGGAMVSGLIQSMGETLVLHNGRRHIVVNPSSIVSFQVSSR